MQNSLILVLLMWSMLFAITTKSADLTQSDGECIDHLTSGEPIDYRYAPIDGDSLKASPDTPVNLNSPIDGSAIRFVRGMPVYCQEDEIKSNFPVVDGYILDVRDRCGEKLPPLKLEQEKGHFYFEVGGEHVPITCGSIDLGITKSGTPWAYSIEKGLFEPDSEMREILKGWEW